VTGIAGTVFGYWFGQQQAERRLPAIVAQTQPPFEASGGESSVGTSKGNRDQTPFRQQTPTGEPQDEKLSEE
jgi:hypothetical protein